MHSNNTCRKKIFAGSGFSTTFSTLNQISEDNAHPLRLIDDILTSLGSEMFGSKLDLKAEYWQLDLQEIAKRKQTTGHHLI